MGKHSLEGTSGGPQCYLLLWAEQITKFSEVPQQLRHRGVYTLRSPTATATPQALQLEKEKSRAVADPRHSWDRTCNVIFMEDEVSLSKYVIW